jgi:hypothetical protein
MRDLEKMAMNQPASVVRDRPAESLPGLPRQPLTPEQQMEALRKVQSQAEQRVKLGVQLFKAAEARVTLQRDLLTEAKSAQEQLREQINQDVAKTLQQYDQWIGRIDENFTKAMLKLQERMDALETEQSKAQDKITQMLRRAEALLDQSRYMLAHIEQQGPRPSARRTKPRPQPMPTSTAAAAADSAACEGEPIFGQLAPAGSGDDAAEREKIYLKLIEQLRESQDDMPAHGSDPWADVSDERPAQADEAA